MPRPHPDNRGFYRILGVEPDATLEEIQIAYERLGYQDPAPEGAHRAQIQQAYRVLGSAPSRRNYDLINLGMGRDITVKSRLDDVRLLFACGALLIGILTFVWYPLYGSRLRNFSAGDRLVDLKGSAFGRVIESSERHTFPSGVSSAAFLVEIDATGELRWFPVADIQAGCRRAN